ncbi:flavin reductase family protein [Nonomuraea turcica]|uniref:flavin reductase family protein n=1 Tax=Nonomuraea sp. G32 TaxID=3067274 RepID=UPI00273BFC0F|nr:flavin reductase family protein [Nonomuraea sp. G32]MDP4506954.1 flavin reductase family protein [Nonomuraea sp. G32]
MNRNAAALNNLGSYMLLMGSIVPRPITLISTVGSDGVPNLAPFSLTTAVSSDPPMLAFTSTRLPIPPDDKQDTLRNIEDTGEFVYNLVLAEYDQKMVDTSTTWPASVNEFARCGFTPGPSSRVGVPRVSESPVSFECVLHRIIECGGGESRLVIGQVVAVHIAEAFIVDGLLDLSRVARTGRMAGSEYVHTDAPFTVADAGIVRDRRYINDYLFEA